MGRLRKSRKQAVSLFPFLDILACVIGNLILIITTVVLEQVDTQPVAEAARIDDLKEEASRQQARAAQLQQQLDALREKSGVATELLEAVRRKIAAARKRIKEAEAEARQASQPIPPPSGLEKELARLEEERRELEKKRDALAEQIAKRQASPEQMIAILPAADKRGPRKGIFVEAAKDGLVIHDGPQPTKVPRGKIGTDPAFKVILERVKADPDAIVTFLVRPDGLPSLAAGQKAADAAGARSGRVPLPGDGPLDFSGAVQ